MTPQPQVVVQSQPAQNHRRRRAGEMAGGGAAECAAVCCCCPCAVLNFLVLAVYKVPAGLLRKAVRRRPRRLVKNGANGKKNDVVLLQPQRSSSATGTTMLEEHLAKDSATEKLPEAVALENDMWARFGGTGFWRSESQRANLTAHR